MEAKGLITRLAKNQLKRKRRMQRPCSSANRRHGEQVTRKPILLTLIVLTIFVDFDFISAQIFILRYQFNFFQALLVTSLFFVF